MPFEAPRRAEWRWISGPNGLPLSNMAIDQAIYEAHAAGMAPATVRVYTWGCPALTIGRLQQAEKARVAFPSLPIIRRPTGGRAVVHGEDLTVAAAVREELVDARNYGQGLLATYFLLLEPVIETLRGYGVCVKRGQDRRNSGKSEDCFQSAAACDLIDAETGLKILGSAQLRSKGTILQQMSLRPLQKVDIASAEFERDLRSRFQEALNVPGWILKDKLTESEITRAKEIEAGAPAFT